MSKIFKELRVEMIERGQLMDDLNEEFLKVQRRLCQFVEKFEGDAQGAKAELVLKISIKAENVEDGAYSVTTMIGTKAPSRPQRGTVAIAAPAGDGQMALFGRAAGTTAEDPRQGRIFEDSAHDGKAAAAGQ